MNFAGIILGASAFIIIGLFHPIVIKAEYHLGKRCWWMFALVGLGFCAAALLAENTVVSSILGVTGFSCFWSILELFQQEKRVKKGWFPSNPKKLRSCLNLITLISYASFSCLCTFNSVTYHRYAPSFQAQIHQKICYNKFRQSNLNSF